jgi:hypothetical protein
MICFVKFRIFHGFLVCHGTRRWYALVSTCVVKHGRFEEGPDTTPLIAQLVQHLTVELAGIRWSLVRFLVNGFC